LVVDPSGVEPGPDTGLFVADEGDETVDAPVFDKSGLGDPSGSVDDKCWPSVVLSAAGKKCADVDASIVGSRKARRPSPTNRA
jgi:hypothetical protein